MDIASRWLEEEKDTLLVHLAPNQYSAQNYSDVISMYGEELSEKEGRACGVDRVDVPVGRSTLTDYLTDPIDRALCPTVPPGDLRLNGTWIKRTAGLIAGCLKS